MTPQEHTKSLANLEIRRKSTRASWKMGMMHVRKTFKSLDEIDAYYNNLVEVENKKLIAAYPAPVKPVEFVTTSNGPATNLIPAPLVIEQDSSVEFYTSPKQVAKLRNWQQAASNVCYKTLFELKHDAHLLSSGVGTGKSYMVGNILRRIIDNNLVEGKTISPYPLVVITAASVVEQFSRDLEYQFGIDIPSGEVLVTNYDQLRSKFGERFVVESTVIKNGEPELVYNWRLMMAPYFIVWDECHKLKNEDSVQSKMAQALNNLPQGRVKQLFMSATSFTRITDAKCFTVATRCSMY